MYDALKARLKNKSAFGILFTLCRKRDTSRRTTAEYLVYINSTRINYYANCIHIATS